MGKRADVPNNDRVRPAKLYCAIVATTALGMSALAVAVPSITGLSLLDHRAAPVPTTAGSTLFPDPTAAVAAKKPTPWRSPAGKVVGEAHSKSIFGPGARDFSDVSRALTAPALSVTCGDVGEVSSPTLAATRRAKVGRYTVVATVAAYPAGMGGASVASLRTLAQNCSTAHDNGTFGVGAESALLTANNGGDRMSVAVFNTGDVVSTVTVTGGLKGSSNSLATSVSQAMASRLGSLLDDGVCASVTAGAGSSSRNPYGPGDYSGLTVDVPVVMPELPDLPLPSASSSPKPTFSVPAGQARPELAPPKMPAGWQSGDAPVKVDDAPRGAAPVLVDPDRITVPKGAPSSSPTSPVIEPSPSRSTSIKAQEPDKVGPGCGWAFTNMTTPNFDDARLARQKAALVRAAAAELTTAQARFRFAKRTYEKRYQQYLRNSEAYEVYEQYRVAVDNARIAWAAAQERYQDAVAALNPPPPPEEEEETPSPTTTPEDETSSPEPDEEETPSPTTTPRETPDTPRDTPSSSPDDEPEPSTTTSPSEPADPSPTSTSGAGQR